MQNQHEVRLPAAKPRESLPPDKYAADFIISYITGIERTQLEGTALNGRHVATIYTNHGRRWCCPKNARQDMPEANPGHFWDRIGKYHQRQVFIERAKGNKPTPIIQEVNDDGTA